MVSIHIGSQGDIKKFLKNAFDAVETWDYALAEDAFNRLRYSIRTYNISRGKSVDKFDDLFEAAIFTLRIATDNNFKKDLMEEHLEIITEAIRNEVPVDPIAHLQELYEEIRHSYGCIGDVDSASNIIACFDEINTLKEQFKENNYFSSMSQQMAASIPLLIQVSKTERAPVTLLSKLADQFSYLFISIQRVLSPPLKINLTKAEIIENLQSGVSLRDIADGTGYNEAELRAMLEDKNVSEDEKDDSSR